MKRKNVKGLALTPAAPKPPPTAENAQQGSRHSRNDTEDSSAQLEIGIEFNLDLRPEDLEIIKDLGSGNGGTVSKARHLPTNTIMARKVSYMAAARQILAPSNLLQGHPRRGEARDAQAHCSRTSDYAWLPLGAHCDILRCLPQRQQRRDYVYGVHGCWVSKPGPFLERM